MRWSSAAWVLLCFASLVSAQGTLGGSQGACGSQDAWVYQGCYSDDDNGPHASFTWQLSSNPNSVYYYPPYNGSVTPGFCQQACRGHGFRYAALYNGVSCYCGTDLPNPSAQEFTSDGQGDLIGNNPGATTSISTCHVPGKGCAGDPSQYCGSSVGTDIYADPSFDDSASARLPQNFQYLGCFYNNPPGPLYVGISTTSTFDCASYCGNLGYAYMGRHGFDDQTDTINCGCGSEVQTGNQVPEANCRYYCNGISNAA